jgi:hypothetical protein
MVSVNHTEHGDSVVGTPREDQFRRPAESRPLSADAPGGVEIAPSNLGIIDTLGPPAR